MNEEYQESIEDPENPVIDVNTSGKEVLSITVLTEDRSDTKLLDGSTENVLLYLHGLHEFLDGNAGALLSESPYISVQRTSAESVYRITVDERPVESMPNQADDVLEALQSAIEEGDLDPIVDVYQEIIDSQVRRDVVNRLKEILPNINEDRIEVTDRGWRIDGYYVVDWTASLYVATDDPDSDDYVRGTGGVTTVEKDHEFVELTPSGSPERKHIKLDGEQLVLGEREMMFLSKVEWILNRTQYHPDEPWWRYVERQRKKFIRGGSNE